MIIFGIWRASGFRLSSTKGEPMQIYGNRVVSLLRVLCIIEDYFTFCYEGVSKVAWLASWPLEWWLVISLRKIIRQQIGAFLYRHFQRHLIQAGERCLPDFDFNLAPLVFPSTTTLLHFISLFNPLYPLHLFRYSACLPHICIVGMLHGHFLVSMANFPFRKKKKSNILLCPQLFSKHPIVCTSRYAKLAPTTP